MKKQPKKRLPKPVPCEALVLFNRETGELILISHTKNVNDVEFLCDRDDDEHIGVIRVRVVPVVAKRRKGAK